MNKKFKVGDIVVLDKEKHLFEVEGMGGNDRVYLKRISTDIITNVYVETYVENVRHATLKEPLKVIEGLVERDTPKKVYKTDYNYCPNCDQHYLIEYSNYCSVCGQRLDWSD